jgi:hypothetical protein
MSIYTSFIMTLNPRTTPDWETGETTYEVTITSTGTSLLPIRCEGRSIREAYDEANGIISELIQNICGDCGEQAPEGDESMRNAGICLPCYDRMMAKR